jgi:hypothetical protein
MISKVGSLQSSQASTLAATRKLEAKPKVEAKPAAAVPRSGTPGASAADAARPAAVVVIGGQARALATQNEASSQSRIGALASQRASVPDQGAARPRLGDSSETRTEIEIEPVVAQPVPDFNSVGKELSAGAASSVYSSASSAASSSASQASSSRQFVA